MQAGEQDGFTHVRKSDITLIWKWRHVMDGGDKPLSTLVAQGWEIISHSAGHDQNGAPIQSFLLRRQKQHRLLQIRPKMMGKGYVVKEFDV